jgi:hypothetical protein
MDHQYSHTLGIVSMDATTGELSKERHLIILERFGGMFGPQIYHGILEVRTNLTHQTPFLE